MKQNKINQPKNIYVIARIDNWCWLNEIFYSRKQAVKHLKQIKDNYPASFNYYRKLKIKKITLRTSEEMKDD